MIVFTCCDPFFLSACPNSEMYLCEIGRIIHFNISRIELSIIKLSIRIQKLNNIALSIGIRKGVFFSPT